MSYRDYDLRAFRMDGTVDHGQPDWPDDSADYEAEWDAEHVRYGPQLSVTLPSRKAILAAKHRGGLVSVDPQALLGLIDQCDMACDLIEDAKELLRYSGGRAQAEWMDRAETLTRVFDEMAA